MKHSEFMVLGLAGVALWLIVKGKAPATQKRAGGSCPAPRTEEIFNSAGQPYDNGWRYFSDGQTGYAIDPAGRYWRDGVMVWAP